MSSVTEVQTSDAGKARNLLDAAAEMAALGCVPEALIPATIEALKTLPDGERHRWLRGKRLAIYRGLYRSPSDSRSSVYQKHAGHAAAMVLHEAGLVDVDNAFRDRETGRKVLSLIYELARLNWADDESLIGTYRNLRSQPLAVVKAVVRQHNPRVQNSDGVA